MLSYQYWNSHYKDKIYGLMQQRRNSIANALDLLFLALTHRDVLITVFFYNGNVCTWKDGLYIETGSRLLQCPGNHFSLNIPSQCTDFLLKIVIITSLFVQLHFLAATKQLYKWYFPSVRPSVCHTFLTMFPSPYHHEIFRSYYQWPK